MSDRKVQIALWQQTLEDEFPARVRTQFSVLEAQSETTFRTKFNGHCTLHNSFIEFFGETLAGNAKLLSTKGWPKDNPSYPALVIKYLGLLRKFRAAELTAAHGYPVEAYAMLRGGSGRSICSRCLGSRLRRSPHVDEIRAARR